MVGGTLLWFLVFAGLVPLILVALFGLGPAMLAYLPVFDLIANLFSNSGEDKLDRWFGDVYDLSPDNLWEYITVNLINLVALTGVLLNLIFLMNGEGIGKREIFLVGFTMFVMTYLLPTRLIKYVSRDMGYGLEAGFVLILTLVFLERYIIRHLVLR